MHHVFIVNPVAGKMTEQGKIISQINEVCKEHGVNYQIYMTKRAGDAREKVLQECEKGDSIRFYACGGDGTINEVANGMLGFKNAQLAAIPCGTGNDFIKNFGDQSLFLNIEAQICSTVHKIDVIQVRDIIDDKIENKIAVNLCSMGLDADVALNMSKFKNLPFVKGSLSYTLSIFYCLIKKVKNDFTVTIDEKLPVKGRFMLGAICNGFCYGGEYMAAPKAMVDDGELDVVLVSTVSRLKVPSLLSFYKVGDHEKMGDILSCVRAKNIHIQSAREVAINIDGECSPIKEAFFEILPQCISMCIPQDAAKADYRHHYNINELTATV